MRQFVIGKGQRILDPKLFCKARHLCTIVLSADIQANDLQSLRSILLLKLDQMRRLCAAGLAPGGIKIQQHNLAFVIRQVRALIVIKRPAYGFDGSDGPARRPYARTQSEC